ncbi:MAG: hypothetical protein L0Z50_21925, partial [Verrucomicrobiales bacterium]|nr:hypothetical protein [Verrucomicrobiales bacterium]
MRPLSIFAAACRRSFGIRIALRARVIYLAVILILSFGFLQSQSAVITWDGGGGDEFWHTIANWSGDTLPSAQDDVLITALDTQITITNSVEVRAFSIASGGSVTVQGSGVSFQATGNTAIDGASLIVRNGARLTLPTLTQYDETRNKTFGVVFESSGAGSVLDLSNATRLSDSTAQLTGIAIRALGGGL